jgi:hypothetical protein
MTKNKNTDRIIAFGNLSARGFNFFPQRTLRPMVALGKTTPHAQKQHICKPHKPTHNQSLQKSCFLALAPVRFLLLSCFNLKSG